MATILDGKEIIWCVFNNDGCECSDFVGTFDTEEAANAAKDRIETLIRKFYSEQMKFEWTGSVEVVQRTLNEYELPLDAILATEPIPE